MAHKCGSLTDRRQKHMVRIPMLPFVFVDPLRPLHSRLLNAIQTWHCDFNFILSLANKVLSLSGG